jgi:hypothetical protein
LLSPAQERRLPRSQVALLDIGANLGSHTMAAAAHGFRVLAFEPMHVNLMALRHTLCANPGLAGRVTLVPKVGGAPCRLAPLLPALRNSLVAPKGAIAR